MRQDFIIENGQVRIGHSDTMHAEDIITLDKGWNKFSPKNGVGAYRYIKGKNGNELNHEIITNLKDDDYEPEWSNEQDISIRL